VVLEIKERPSIYNSIIGYYFLSFRAIRIYIRNDWSSRRLEGEYVTSMVILFVYPHLVDSTCIVCLVARGLSEEILYTK